MPWYTRKIADDIVGAITGTRGAAATEIAFISTRRGPREVALMNADGSNTRPATWWRREVRLSLPVVHVSGDQQPGHIIF